MPRLILLFLSLCITSVLCASPFDALSTSPIASSLVIDDQDIITYHHAATHEETTLAIPTPYASYPLTSNYADTSAGRTGSLVSTSASTATFVPDTIRTSVWSRTKSTSPTRVTLPFILPRTYTKSVWIYTSTATQQYWIASESTSTNGVHHLGLDSNGRLSAGHNARTSTSILLSDSVPFPINQWVHVAVTYSYSNRLMVLYKDGNVVASRSVGAISTANQVALGNYGRISDNGLNGRMSQAVIYNQALTPAQIQEVYTAEFKTVTTAAPTTTVAPVTTTAPPTQAATTQPPATTAPPTTAPTTAAPTAPATTAPPATAAPTTVAPATTAPTTAAPTVAPTTAAPSGPVMDSEERAFVQLINDYRIANGLVPLQLSVTITNAAEWMAKDMGDKNYFSHTDSLNRDPFVRMEAFGHPKLGYRGENIAAGNALASATFTQWKNSAGHNANMLNGNFKIMGIARYYSATSTYKWYWVNDFGSYIDAILP